MEELRTVVNEGASIPGQRQHMLLGVLDLEKVTVDDIMVPRSEIVGIDMDDDINHILDLMAASQHTRLPVYQENINNIIGVLHLRRVAKHLPPSVQSRTDHKGGTAAADGRALLRP